jgi:hypothetical protein
MDGSTTAPERGPDTDLPVEQTAPEASDRNGGPGGAAGQGDTPPPGAPLPLGAQLAVARESAPPLHGTDSWAICCSGGGIRSATYCLAGPWRVLPGVRLRQGDVASRPLLR